ncbi:MAG: hypothetical protein ACPGU1_11945 [Myxococcota bacterium]
MKPNRPILVALTLTFFMACSSSEEAATTPKPAKPLASIAATAPTQSAKSVAGEAPAEAASPRSEEALIQTVARTLGRRDLKTLQGLATEEFAADLQRMHDMNPTNFWIRSSIFIQNVKTGFEVLHRQEDTREQWNIVLRFGNGQEERLTFTREGGKLLIVDL